MNALDQAIANTTPFSDTPIFFGKKLFTVEEKPISSDYGIIEGKKGLFVDKRSINIVSSRYEVHQPKEIAQQFHKVSRTHGLEVNRVMANPKNGGLLLSAKFAGTRIAGENHDVNLTFYTSHCGKYKTFLSLDTLRIACFNQLPALYQNKSRFLIAEKHYKNALDIDSLGNLLSHIPESIQSHNDKLETLKSKSLSLDDFISLWQDHYKVDQESKRYQTKVDALKSVYYNAVGQSLCPEGSAYKALQCITFENTHSGRDTAMKHENVLIKNGNDSLVWLDNLLML